MSDPPCEELVRDRCSWRRFVGLGWQAAVPDETTLVRFRQRLRAHGWHGTLPPFAEVSDLEKTGGATSEKPPYRKSARWGAFSERAAVLWRAAKPSAASKVSRRCSRMP
ncbi:MAG: transposase [Verrucomicrobia bacterium]|nr:MAG: transposase [Verrucomicrobiota bacterium]